MQIELGLGEILKGAEYATDTRKALVVKFAIRQVVTTNVRPHVAGRPTENGIDVNSPVFQSINERAFSTARGFFGTNSGYFYAPFAAAFLKFGATVTGIA